MLMCRGCFLINWSRMLKFMSSATHRSYGKVGICIGLEKACRPILDQPSRCVQPTICRLLRLTGAEAIFEKDEP